MFDTIRLYKQGVDGKDFVIDKSQFKKSISVDDEVESYVNQFGSGLVRVSYDRSKKGLSIAFSAPKLAFGTQIENIKVSNYDLLLSNLVNILEGVVDVDYSNMKVSRLDITSNLELDGNVKYYINTLQSKFRKVGNYKTDFYKDESFTIFNKSRRFIFYDKIKEQMDKGVLVGNYERKILRYEIQNKRGRDIYTLLKRNYTFKELFRESVFIDCIKVQKQFYSKFFTNGGHISFFETERALIEAVKLQFGSRNLIRNYLLKSYLSNGKVNYQTLETLFTDYYSKRGLSKALKELKELEFLSVNTDYSILIEIENKINNLHRLVS